MSRSQSPAQHSSNGSHNRLDYIAAVCNNQHLVIAKPLDGPRLRCNVPSKDFFPFHPCSPLCYSFYGPDQPYQFHESPVIRAVCEESFYTLESLRHHCRAPRLPLLGAFGDRAMARIVGLRSPLYDADAAVLKEEACRLAALIHIRASSRLIPHHADCNVSNLSSLHRILRTVDLCEWRGMPFVYLWV